MSDESSLREHFEDGIWIGEWFVEPMRNRVRLEDEEVQVEPKVMEVLLCLAKRPGKTVTKDQFMDEVWRETIVTDDVLSRCISQLRKVFDDDPKDPSYIETIRKTGYRLVASVERPEETEAASSDGGSSTTTEDRGQVASPTQYLLHLVKDRVPEEVWNAVFGRLSPRTQGLVLSGLVGIVLLSMLVWVASVGSAGNEAPISAVPFTSFPGEEFDPVLSSAGHKVAFAWREPSSDHQNIYLMQQGADQPLQLSADSTTEWSPTWSPDDRFVAYVLNDNGTHRIAVVPSIGGQPSYPLSRPHRDIQSIAWMPNPEQRTLVVSTQQRPHQALALYRFTPDADSLVSLTSPPLWSTGDMDPVASPDGSQIAFVRGTVRGVQDIFVVDASGGTPTQITEDSTEIDGISWSADGSDILYSAERDDVFGLWRVSPDGGEPTLIRSASEGTRFSQPAVSAESNRLVYTQTSDQLDIWKLSRHNEYADYTPASLVSSTQKDLYPSISPSGEQIAFVSNRSGTPEIWLAQADGSASNQLTSLGGPRVMSIRWSPTGERLCFVTRRDGQSDLYLVSVSGGTPSRLTNSPAEDLVPRWAGNSRWVYFSSNRTGNWEAWRARASGDSTRVQQVTTGGAVAAQISRTDSTFYYVRPDTSGIWTITMNASRLPLDTHVASVNFPINIVGQFNPGERRNWWVGENGLHFVHRQSNTALLAYLNLGTGRILPVYEFYNWRPVQSIDVGPNGEWFAYTYAAQRESDIMLVENFR